MRSLKCSHGSHEPTWSKNTSLDEPSSIINDTGRQPDKCRKRSLPELERRFDKVMRYSSDNGGGDHTDVVESKYIVN